jgi:hypothetical protein
VREGEQVCMDSSSAADMAAHIGHGKLQRSGSGPSLVFLADHTDLFFRYSTYPKAKFLDKEKEEKQRDVISITT